MPKTDIKAMIKDWKKSELRELISVAQEVLSSLFNSSEIRDNVKESRFSKGYECPKCQCKNVNKNGKSNERQRYICKNCRTSFDEFTLSPFSNTKLGLDKWLKYCELMILGLSIRKCAQEIGVGVKTSFYMRHRILDVINLSLKNDKVEGIVEVDECFGDITRAEFVSLVNKVYNFKEKGNVEFKEVKKGQWFYEDISIGVKAGYINGKSKDRFAPNDKITREEAMTILTNISKNKDKNLDKLEQFKDKNKVSAWAKSSVEGAIEAGYLDNSNKIRPKDKMTRAEAISILAKAI